MKRVGGGSSRPHKRARCSDRPTRSEEIELVPRHTDSSQPIPEDYPVQILYNCFRTYPETLYCIIDHIPRFNLLYVITTFVCTFLASLTQEINKRERYLASWFLFDFNYGDVGALLRNQEAAYRIYAAFDRLIPATQTFCRWVDHLDRKLSLSILPYGDALFTPNERRFKAALNVVPYTAVTFQKDPIARHLIRMLECWYCASCQRNYGIPARLLKFILVQHEDSPPTPAPTFCKGSANLCLDCLRIMRELPNIDHLKIDFDLLANREAIGSLKAYPSNKLIPLAFVQQFVVPKANVAQSVSYIFMVDNVRMITIEAALNVRKMWLRENLATLTQ